MANRRASRNAPTAHRQLPAERPPRKAPYHDTITRHLANLGRDGEDPRRIEALPRPQFSTLDRLSPETFRREVALACGCIDEGGVEQAERCARSFGP